MINVQSGFLSQWNSGAPWISRRQNRKVWRAANLYLMDQLWMSLWMVGYYKMEG